MKRKKFEIFHGINDNSHSSTLPPVLRRCVLAPYVPLRAAVVAQACCGEFVVDEVECRKV